MDSSLKLGFICSVKLRENIVFDHCMKVADILKTINLVLCISVYLDITP